MQLQKVVIPYHGEKPKLSEERVVRVPTPSVSLVDLVVEVEKPTTAVEVNAALKAAARSSVDGAMGYTEVPLVSMNYIGSIHGGVVDSLCTTVMNGTMANIIVCYDSEASFSSQLLRLARMVGASL